jgi:hypothetical protein
MPVQWHHQQVVWHQKTTSFHSHQASEMVVRLLGVHHMTGNTCDILEAFAALCLHQPHTEAVAVGCSTAPPWCSTAAGLPSFLQQLVPHLRLIVCGVCICCVFMLRPCWSRRLA